MSTGLSNAQVAQYHRDGYLFPLTAIGEPQAKALRTRIEALEATYRDGVPGGRDLNQYFRVNAHHVLPLAVEIATIPAMLDAVQSIIGPNILIWSCEFFIKEAGSDKVVTWHQDMTYWGLGEDSDGDTDQLVSAWIALSPATVASGCMRFVAGSHKRAIQPHRDTFSHDNLLSRGQEMAVEVDEGEATDIVLRPGQFSLHHGRTFHASGPNVSGDRRIGIVMRYVTPRVRQLVGTRDYATLVRGYDDQHNWIKVAPPDRDFPEHATALYEQVLADQAAALAKGAEVTVGLYAEAGA